MKKLTIAAGVAISLISAQASAVTVLASLSCGVWVHDREVLKKAEQAPVDKDALYDARTDNFLNSRWLLGYLSGLAVASNKDFLKQTDAQSISLWTDNYCAQNPLDDLSDAGQVLMRTLSKRTGRK